MIETLGLDAHVKLVGPQSQDEVLSSYRRAAVFALPCIVAGDGNRDGLPTVMLEAMAAGLPVVSTRLVGVPEIVDHGVDGLLVEPGDPVALAASLARLLQDAELRDHLGQAARRKVGERFDVRRNVRQLKAWLEDGVERGGWRVEGGGWSDGADGYGAQDSLSLSLPVTPALAEVLPVL